MNYLIVIRPSECEDLNNIVDGVYPVYPGGNTRRFYVYCIMRDNKKWTVSIPYMLCIYKSLEQTL